MYERSLTPRKRFYDLLYILAGTTPTDMTPPVISNCPSDTIIPVASGTTSATVNWVEPTATDGDGLTPTVARSHAPNTAFPLGPTVVNYIFRDSTGNEANCNFIVTVAEGRSDCLVTVAVINN